MMCRLTAARCTSACAIGLEHEHPVFLSQGVIAVLLGEVVSLSHLPKTLLPSASLTTRQPLGSGPLGTKQYPLVSSSNAALVNQNCCPYLVPTVGSSKRYQPFISCSSA